MVKRICHFTSVHSATDGRIFEKECCSLAKAGYEVYFVAPNAKTEIKNGVHIVGVPISNRGRLYRMLCGAKIIYKEALSLNADVYHFHDPELLRFALKLKSQGKKVIFDSHEFYGYQIKEKEYLPRFFRYIVGTVYMWFETFVCKRIDAVIQVCTVCGQNYFEGRSKKNIFIANVPHMNILSFYKETKNIDVKKTVVYIGGLTYNRGISFLIEAVDKSIANLILAGKISNQYKTQIRALEGFKKVDYKGCISSERVYALLNSSSIGVSTLLKIGQYGKLDTLPTKIYEYMAMGLPVIMSNTDYNIRMNATEQFGICVNPCDVNEIAKAINYLLENSNLAEELGRNGRRLIENKYNWEIEEQKLLNLYTSL